MAQPSPVQFQIIRLLFIDSDNMLNQHVIEAFLKRYGIEAKASEEQMADYSSNICVTAIDIPDHQIRLESFDFTYKFHQLSHARQVEEVTHLIVNYDINYIFSDFCLNKLTVSNEKSPSSNDARVFYYSTHQDEVVNMFGGSNENIKKRLSDPGYADRKTFLTGAGGVLSKLKPDQVKSFKGIVLYGLMSHKMSYDLDGMKKKMLQQIATAAGVSIQNVGTEVVFLDTSTFFTKANDTEFCLERENWRIKASARIRKEYSKIVGHVLFQWFEALRRKSSSTTNAEDIARGVEAIDNPDDYFSLNNLDISSYLKTLNRLNILSEQHNDKEVAWNIGATSFFVTGFNYKKEYFLVDVPFRDYGDELEKYIEKEKISRFSYEINSTANNEFEEAFKNNQISFCCPQKKIWVLKGEYLAENYEEEGQSGYFSLNHQKIAEKINEWIQEQQLHQHHTYLLIHDNEANEEIKKYGLYWLESFTTQDPDDYKQIEDLVTKASREIDYGTAVEDLLHHRFHLPFTERIEERVSNHELNNKKPPHADFEKDILYLPNGMTILDFPEKIRPQIIDLKSRFDILPYRL